ncbi:hypothetical protein [Brevibacillus sp. 179-C9.3 HS]|uniref:hypothetical protein n=1 Tax=unclassified Brevibacillus TaxID=2684853 RepID=UPI0039A1FCD5
MYTTDELERMIREVKTLGNYKFHEEKQCFYGDAEIEIYARKLGNDTYSVYEFYYFDGIEVSAYREGEEPYVFQGTEEEVRAKIIDSYHSESGIFMGYPVLYINISVVFDFDAREYDEYFGIVRE